MTISAKQLLKNVTNMTSAYAGRKILSFVYFILIARYTSLDITGFYFLMISFASVVATLIDFGLANTLIREGSKNPEKLEYYLRNVLGLKLVLSGLAVFFGVLLLYLLDYPTTTRHIVMIVIAMTVIESISDTFYGCLRVHHKMIFEARAIVIGQIITLAVGGGSLLFYPSLYLLIVALFLNQFYHFVYSTVLIRRELGYTPSPSLEKKILLPFGKITIPFLVAALFSQLLYANTFILKYLTTDRIVGVFASATALIGAFRFVPMAMESAIFPAFSSFHANSHEKLTRTFDLFFESLLIFVVPTALVMSVFSETIIHAVYGLKYLESVPVLQILAFSMIPFFLSQPVGRLLDACNLQVINTLLLGACLLLNLILTFFFIPHFGAVGISLACLLSFTLLLAAGLYFISKVIQSSTLTCLQSLARTAVAGGAMWLSMNVLKSTTHPLMGMGMGVLLFFLLTGILRGFTLQGFSRRRAYEDWLSLTKRVFE